MRRAMRTHSIAAAALLALAGTGFVAAQARPEKQEQESLLEERMHAIEEELRALRRLVRDPAHSPQALAALARVQAAAVAAKSETPRHAAQIPEAERAKFAADYRREMVLFLERSLGLERALLDGDSEAARAAYDALDAMEDAAHERFAPEADEE
jgi:hypothetical protein